MKLTVQDLNSFYGQAHILFDVALEVGEGEVVALLGRNGAGKSTTFRSIIGLVESRTGKIVFEGNDVSATCRKSGASSPISRSTKISRSVASRSGRTRRTGPGKNCSRCFRISP